MKDIKRLKKTDLKAYRSLSKEQVQDLLAFRKRGFVEKNKKAYNRKIKHKINIMESDYED